MEITTFNPGEWLNLGTTGAILFIVLIFIILTNRNSAGKNNDIQSLCSKIDKLIDSNGETVKTLSTSMLQWAIEQKATLTYLERIERLSIDSTSKLDTLGGKVDVVLGINKEKLV